MLPERAPVQAHPQHTTHLCQVTNFLFRPIFHSLLLLLLLFQAILWYPLHLGSQSNPCHFCENEFKHEE